ncbi:hypothetical protein EV368DRAFT_61928 [Lentinula lateritia]|nr:hypothetical protein EV368DRAFT_61928 [Lentinula lateritia]
MEQTTNPSSDYAKDVALPKSHSTVTSSFNAITKSGRQTLKVAIYERLKFRNNPSLFSELEVERRVHAVTAAYHDGLPIVLVLLEDSALLPTFSQEQLHFEVHVFLGQYQWASGFDTLSQVSFGGYLSPPSSAIRTIHPTATYYLWAIRSHPNFTLMSLTTKEKTLKLDGQMHRDQYLKLANLRIPELEAEMNLLYAQTLEFKGGNEHQQNLFHSRKKRYEFLAATIELMKLDIFEVSNRKISSEKLRITPSDTEIGHVFMACFGFVNDTSISTSKSDSIFLPQHIPLTPSASQPTSLHQNQQFIDVSLIKFTNQLLIPPPSIPQHFSSIQELRPGQKIVLDCMAVQPLRIGKIGALESFFGLPDPICTTRNPIEISDAKYFMYEYCVTKHRFAVPGASGAIVRTSAEGAACNAFNFTVIKMAGSGCSLLVVRFNGVDETEMVNICAHDEASVSNRRKKVRIRAKDLKRFRHESYGMRKALVKVNGGGNVDVVVVNAGASHESSTFNAQLQRFPEIESAIVKTLEDPCKRRFEQINRRDRTSAMAIEHHPWRMGFSKIPNGGVFRSNLKIPSIFILRGEGRFTVEFGNEKYTNDISSHSQGSPLEGIGGALMHSDQKVEE